MWYYIITRISYFTIILQKFDSMHKKTIASVKRCFCLYSRSQKDTIIKICYNWTFVIFSFQEKTKIPQGFRVFFNKENKTEHHILQHQKFQELQKVLRKCGRLKTFWYREKDVQETFLKQSCYLQNIRNFWHINILQQ